MTMKQAMKKVETPAHMAKDRKAGIKEGSKRDLSMDRAEARRMMKKGKGY